MLRERLMASTSARWWTAEVDRARRDLKAPVEPSRGRPSCACKRGPKAPFAESASGRLIRGEGQKRDVAGALDGLDQRALVDGAHAAGAAGQDLAALGREGRERL